MRKRFILLLMVFVFIYLVASVSVAGTKFEIIHPEKKKPVYDSIPLIQWTSYPDATRYHLIIAAESDIKKKPESIVDEEKYLGGTTYRPKVFLNFKMNYYLTLRVYVNDKKKKEIKNYRFILDYAPPADILSPENTKVINSVNPTFSWKSYSGVGSYDIELASEPKIEKSILFDKKDVGNIIKQAGHDGKLGTNDDVLICSYELPENLKPKMTYYWRVRSVYKQNEAVVGKSKWSAIYSFSIAEESVKDEIINLYQVTEEEELDECEPVLAPNGTMIAYTVKNKDGSSEIWVKKAISLEEKGTPKKFEAISRKFTTTVGGSRDEEPEWTTDSKGIIFTSDRERGIKNIWMKSIGGIGIVQLTNSSYGCFNGKMSPDGNRIIYVALTKDKEPFIWAMNTDGTKKTQLVRGMNPSWANKSRAITYNNEVNGQQEIFYLNLATGAEEQITNSEGEYSSIRPIWSPDDSRITYNSNKGGNWDVWIMGSRGQRNKRQLTSSFVADKDPSWGNSSSVIYFSSTRGEKGSLDIWRGDIP